MGFLAPVMLWGAAAASIPIALHFFFRSRYRTVHWAAMRFLLAAIEQTSRRMRFQELLLLLVRVLLLVLLALALARPLSTSVRGMGQSAAVHAVFLFDTSMSMGAADGVKTRLERAQDAALSILDQLPPHSTVQIITCADRAELDRVASESSLTARNILGLLGPRLSENVDQARTIIKDLKPTSLATDLHDGMYLASTALEQENGNRELYIFTDMQRSAWETQAAKIKKLMEEIGQKTSVTVVRCGQQELNNAAIVSVIPQTDVPRPGERVDFAVQISHTAGKADINDLQLTLIVDGQEVVGQSKSIKTLKKGRTESITMSGKLDKPGLHTVTVLMNKDDLPGDNRYDYVVRVPDYFRILIVDGGSHDPEDKERASLASSYYVMHQIAPVAETEYTRFHVQQARVRTRMASASQLTAGPNQPKLDLCVLVNCGMPPADAEEKTSRNVLSHSFLAQLEQFVKAGGSLLIYSGDKVWHQEYNKILGEKYHLLPLPLKGKVEEFKHDHCKHVERKSFDLPVYQKFRDDKHFEDFNKIEIYKAFLVEEPLRKEFRAKEDKDKKDKKDELPLTPEEKKEEEKKQAEEEKKRLDQEKLAENVRVLLRYTNAWPAVISRKVGDGEVIFITTSADPGALSAKDLRTRNYTWNTWALNPMAEPFMKNTLAHLMAGTSQEHNYTAGKTFIWNARENSDKAFTLYHPKTEEQEPDKKEYNGEAKKNILRKFERLGLPAKDPHSGKIVVKAGGLYQAGIYNLQALNPTDETKADEKNDKSEGLPVAVIPDLNESLNLETFKDDEFNKFLGFTPAPRHLLAGTGAERSTGTDRLNREWTLWILWLLLILAVCECALAYWCGRTL